MGGEAFGHEAQASGQSDKEEHRASFYGVQSTVFLSF